MRVNLVNPGPVRTQMRAKAFPGEDPETLPTPEDVVPLFLDLASPAVHLQRPHLDLPRMAEAEAVSAGNSDDSFQRPAPRSIELDDHAVVGGLNAFGQFAPQRLVVDVGRHVSEDRALRLQPLDPFQRALDAGSGSDAA